LECRLSRLSLNSAPAFIAISYTWEVALPLVSVTLNGHEFSIRENLHSALRQFNTSAPGAYFWVDAICIDQTCVPERNTQVPLMKDIYSTASRGWVWLGDGTHRTRTLVSMLYDIKYLQEAQDPQHDMDLIGYLDPLLHSLENEKEEWILLLLRPWFNRTWIL
ncbi:heterokaryon incompatibility, partial [Clohesyomyces aquaticus]